MAELQTKNIRRTAGIIQRRNDIYFYICVLPWILGFLGFTIGPMLYSLYGALSKWDGVTPPSFVGMKNFVRLLTFDELFLKSLYNTFRYVIMSVPTSVLLALLLAFLLNTSHKGTGLFQVIFIFHRSARALRCTWYGSGCSMPSWAYSTICCRSWAYRDQTGCRIHDGPCRQW